MRADTPERLLKAAEKVFAEHGFGGATVQMIAREAGANVAAINYHFGSKAELFAEFVRRQIDALVGRMPRLADRPGDPRGQLRRFIRWFYERFQERSPLRQMNRDMMVLKRDFFESMIDRAIRPEFDCCRELVAALLPPGASNATLRLWSKCIIALCTGPIQGGQIQERVFPGAPFNQAEIDRQADHVTQFILDGLAADAARIKAAARKGDTRRA